MELIREDREDGIVLVRLAGALDIAGAEKADLPFSVIAGSRDRLIVDFARVDFLASIGVRILVRTARTMGNRGGKVVLVAPQEGPRRVLASTGVDTILTVVEDEAAAVAALT
jgi:anti-anti-sigma factor